MIMAVDYGERYIGLAITDQEEAIAVRHSTVDQRKEAGLKKVMEIAQQERVGLVLVGLPVNLGGQDTQQTAVSRQFIQDLTTALGDKVVVEGADETLTSVEAERQIQWEGGSKNEAHAEAARLILQDYLKKQS